MAVFRIERTRDYTVMSNHHLRNVALSLKAKGLLSMMLSLPDDWNYTTRGLAKICKEGVDAIGGALRELEREGYIVRHQLRDAQGRISDTEYVIYEQPQHKVPDIPSPDTAAPDTDSPHRPPIPEGLQSDAPLLAPRIPGSEIRTYSSWSAPGNGVPLIQPEGTAKLHASHLRPGLSGSQS